MMEPFSNVVNLEYRVSKSFEGRYFMGHTPTLALSGRAGGWAALFNPRGSGVNVFFNTLSVSNFSASPVRALMWLNAVPEKGETSAHVGAANAAYEPPAWPEAVILYGRDAGTPRGGQSLFSRVAGAYETTVGNYYGKIVVPPGSSFLVQLQGLGMPSVQAEVAFGWWEEPA